MKIALIVAPFIAVPPADYGGTELFVAHLAEGLQNAGAEVVVYANGESSVNVDAVGCTRIPSGQSRCRSTPGFGN